MGGPPPAEPRPYVLANIMVAPDGCWLWTGNMSRNGYGKANIAKRTRVAHRVSYEAFRGPIPAGLQLDHVVCDERSCVNPWHVEPRTNRENVLRGVGLSAENARKTHCIHGHKFTPENTRVYRRPGREPERTCRACCRETARRKRARNRNFTSQERAA